MPPSLRPSPVVRYSGGVGMCREVITLYDSLIGAIAISVADVGQCRFYGTNAPRVPVMTEAQQQRTIPLPNTWSSMENCTRPMNQI
ncbi:hypothetical protein NDU88_010432 [Pleurodeles waltl]|uniref:Uncharacterized protein n=1 Tax=Pleurodeles waltl TaxID=8319 RepID=A0AAV7S1A5_PLEWA|nr:hypothetical protein NDU88_010432 [Pleurodeles waltl]